MLDALMPEKLIIEEEPAIVDDVAPAAGLKAAARLSAVRPTAVVEASAPNDGKWDWRGPYAICLDLLPIEAERQIIYYCCSKKICAVCSLKCDDTRPYDTRCPLCRVPAPKSDAEGVRWLQEHVDKGNAQVHLGDAYREGGVGLKQNFKRALQCYELAAAQGHAEAQDALGQCYECGQGVKINLKTAAQWYRRAAEQGYPAAQHNVGAMFYEGKGVAQSFEEAVRWYRLAAQQGDADALYYLGWCHALGQGVARDLDAALRCSRRAAAKGQAEAEAATGEVAALAVGERLRGGSHSEAGRPE